MKRSFFRLLGDRRGFGGHPQPELMIVVAVIGILAAIAIPRFAQLIEASNQAGTKGNLAVVRIALTSFHEETAGRYPYHPSVLAFGGRYVNELPVATPLRSHPKSSKVRLGTDAWDADDSGGWLYAADHSSKHFGAIYVNCTHTDSKGTMWTAY